MHDFTKISALALGIAGALAFGQAQASGFQLREQSVKNLGRSGAGSTVGKNDASVVSLNPAGMANVDKNTVQADFTVIDLDADFVGGGQVLAGTPLASPISGGNGGDPGDPTLVPNIAAVFPLHGALEGMVVGASIGAPFGLKTEYDPSWVGRYRAIESDVKTEDLTLSVAFKASEGISFGIGLVYERAEATLSKAIDYGTIACASQPGGPANCSPLAPFPIKPQSADGLFQVDGDSTGFGFLVGGQIATDKVTIGVSYRSQIDHDLEGDLQFGAPTFIAGNPLVASRFANGAGGAELITPSITTVSVSYDVTDDFRVMADWQKTGWSSLQDVTITRADGTVVGSEEFGWKDSNFLSLGAEYDIGDAFTVRAGVGKDHSPTNATTRTPRLPDNDRQLYSVGLTWNASENFSVDAAFQRIEIDDPTIGLSPNFTTGGSDFASLQGTYSGSANLYGISAQYRF
jgi:long-chain fatty acid transport protein